jgi:hypothetical protein
MIEAMKQAVEIIKNMRSGYGDDYPTEKERKTITALRQAIEQAEKQEPVVEVQYFGEKQIFVVLKQLSDGDKLYTAPPKREWVGLTEKEIFEADNAGQGLIEFARAIETKLKERNT